MSVKHIFLVFLFGFSLLSSVFAQEERTRVDTTLLLKAIEISETTALPKPITPTQQYWKLNDSLHVLGNNLSDLLQSESTIYIKSYGAGSSATTSIRGGSAGQTLVLWNDIPLQSPMLGLLDLSLLPPVGADKVQLLNGGNSAQYGSNAVSGVIRFDSELPFGKLIQLKGKTSIGSFGLFNQEAQLNVSNYKIQSSTRLHFAKAKNDFTYNLGGSIPERKIRNAAYDQTHLFQSIGFLLSDSQKIRADLWFSDAFRQIPPVTTQSVSAANQEDRALRSTLSWTGKFNKWNWQSKAAFFHEEIHYRDSLILIDAPSEFNSIILDTKAGVALSKNSKLKLGINAIQTSAYIEDYGRRRYDFQSGIFGTYILDFQPFQLKSTLRLASNKTDGLRLIPQLEVAINVLENGKLFSKIGRQYRVPTLNDRYWLSGGNEDLKSEIGWSQEIGFNYSPKRLPHLSAAFYNRLIKNWIIWLPLEESAPWTAQNATEIWSRGLELNATKSWHFPKGKHLSLKSGYEYNLTSHQNALEGYNAEKGDQLFYTPKHKAFAKATLKFQSIKASVWYRHTSSSIGVNEHIDAYHLWNAELEWVPTFAKKSTYQVNIFGRVLNLTNRSYFIIERRPMPVRSIEIGIRYSGEKRAYE